MQPLDKRGYTRDDSIIAPSSPGCDLYWPKATLPWWYGICSFTMFVVWGPPKWSSIHDNSTLIWERTRNWTTDNDTNNDDNNNNNDNIDNTIVTPCLIYIGRGILYIADSMYVSPYAGGGGSGGRTITAPVVGYCQPPCQSTQVMLHQLLLQLEFVVSFSLNPLVAGGFPSFHSVERGARPAGYSQ